LRAKPSKSGELCAAGGVSLAREPGLAHDQGADDGRRLRDPVALQFRHLEPGALSRRQRVSVGVAAAPEPAPRTLQAVLPAGHVRGLRAHVLEEQQPSLRFQHACDLRECGGGVGDRAQHERRNHRVEAPVGKWQLLPARRRHLDLSAACAEPVLELSAHVAVWLGQHELGHRVGIELEVDARASANFERAPLSVGEQRPPLVAQSGVLRDLVEAVIAAGEQRSPDRIGELAGHGAEAYWLPPIPQRVRKRQSPIPNPDVAYPRPERALAYDYTPSCIRAI